MAYWQLYLTIFLVIAVAGLAIYAAASSISFWLDRRQTKKLKILARKWGFDYRENLRIDTPDTIWQFQFFNYGRDRKISKLIQGQRGDVTISIGDYSYVSGNKRVYQTVIVIQSPNLILPSFMLMPGGKFEQSVFKAFGVFPYNAIRFRSHPKFSSRYLLGGTDEAAIREYFQEEILSFYERQRYTSSEGLGSCLLFSHGYRLSPRKWKGFMNTALEAYELFLPRY